MEPLSAGKVGRRIAVGLAAVVLLAIVGASSGWTKDWSHLTLAVASPGTGSSTGDEAFRGFELELAKELCRRMAADCSMVAQDRDRILAGLLAGTADAVMAGLPVTPAAAAIVGFTQAYAEPRHGFAIARSGTLARLPGTGKSLSLKIAPGDAQAAIDDLRAALRGRRIGAATGTADLRFLEIYLADVATIGAYPTSDAAAQDLLQGRLDAIMAPTTALAVAGERPGFQALLRAGPEFGQDDLFGEGIAVALRQSDRDLRDKFGRAIDGMIADGSLRALSLRWFATDVTPHRCNCKPF